MNNKIAYFRGIDEISQRELARRVGISNAELSRIENGKRRPNVDIAIKLAEELNTTVEILFKNDN